MAWRAALAAVLAAASLAVPANAHEGDPNVFTRVDAITPPLPGVTVEVRAGVADQLLVVNTTDQPVEVLNDAGRAFLRIGPETVQADHNVADWHTSNSPLGLARTPAPTTKQDWRVVARGNSWGWFDHRLHDRAYQRPPSATTTTRLADWAIPLRHGGRAVAVKGHVEYRPVLGAFRARVAKVPDGVDLDALDGRVPGLFLRWTGTGTLTVRGIEGEPFARLTPQGTEVNDASATWQDDQRLRGKPVTTPADPATPRWRREVPEALLTWLDRRLAYAPGVPPDDALRSSRPTTVVEWDIAVDVDGEPGFLQGVTTWVPAAAESPLEEERPTWVAYVLAAVAVVVATWALRKQRER